MRGPRRVAGEVQRKKRALTGEAEERFRSAAGMGVKELAKLLSRGGIGDAAEYLKGHPALAGFLDRTVGTVAYRPSSPRRPTSCAKSRTGTASTAAAGRATTSRRSAPSWRTT